jgi:hypothetical protein
VRIPARKQSKPQRKKGSCGCVFTVPLILVACCLLSLPVWMLGWLFIGVPFAQMSQPENLPDAMARTTGYYGEDRIGYPLPYEVELNDEIKSFAKSQGFSDPLEQYYPVRACISAADNLGVGRAELCALLDMLDTGWRGSETDAESLVTAYGVGLALAGADPSLIEYKFENEEGDDENEPPGEPPKEGECQVSGGFAPAVRQWCTYITISANKYGFPPDLIAALIDKESDGDPNAISSAGAVGLMQVMPRDGVAGTYMCKYGPCFADRPTTAELLDPEFNIQFGTKYLAYLLTVCVDSKPICGNIREALKAYGPRDVGYTYADDVLAIYQSHGTAGNYACDVGKTCKPVCTSDDCNAFYTFFGNYENMQIYLMNVEAWRVVDSAELMEYNDSLARLPAVLTFNWTLENLNVGEYVDVHGIPGVVTDPGTIVGDLPEIPTGKFVHPVPNGHVSGYHFSKAHKGTDYNCRGMPNCDWIARASNDGVISVSTCENTYGYGCTTIIKSELDGTPLCSLYGHGAALQRSVGDVVKAGDPIFRIGDTGNSYGAHLHFELRLGGTGPWCSGATFLNPEEVLPPQ